MTTQADYPVLFLLLGIVIFLALLAAVGAWMRSGGLKREDAEGLLSESEARQKAEIEALRNSLEEMRRKSEEGHSRTEENLNRTQETVGVRMRELESVVAGAAREHGENLSSQLESVTRAVAESEQRVTRQMEGLNDTIVNLHSQMKLAGDQMTKTLTEMARQQREQKAQSTIQLCEALISSLGTLKSSIASQIQHEPVDATEAGEVTGGALAFNERGADAQRFDDPEPEVQAFNNVAEPAEGAARNVFGEERGANLSENGDVKWESPFVEEDEQNAAPESDEKAEERPAFSGHDFETAPDATEETGAGWAEMEKKDGEERSI